MSDLDRDAIVRHAYGVNQQPFDELYDELARMSSMMTYLHEPLTDPSKQIRLLQVLPGDRDGDVYLNLSTWHMSNAPIFNAISYTWGEERHRNVFINGCVHSVRRSCHYVLWQVRIHCPGEYIWIDSICINQTDNNEKGPQVQMMGNIYKQACKVFTCLGPHYDESELLVVVAHEAATSYFHETRKDNAPVHKLSETSLKNFINSLQFLDDKDTVLAICSAFQAFMKRPYWSRLWIIQEVAAASGSNHTILCGQDKMSRTGLELLYHITEKRVDGAIKRAKKLRLPIDHLEPSYELDVSTLYTVITTHYEDTQNIGEVFVEYAEFGCVDPPDRLYGLLSLIKWPESLPPILADYAVSALNLALKLCIHIDFGSTIKMLDAFNIDYSHREMRQLVHKKMNSQHDNTERFGGNVTVNPNIFKLNILEKWERHCSILHEDSDGNLTAVLAKRVHYPRAWDHVDFFRQKVDELQESIANETKPKFVVIGSTVVALLCSGARKGDLLIPIEFDSVCGPMLVLRHSHNDQYEIIGQGFAIEGFSIPHRHEVRDDACIKLDKARWLCFHAEVQLQLLPEDFLLLLGHDRADGEFFDPEARMQRLLTPITSTDCKAMVIPILPIESDLNQMLRSGRVSMVSE